MTELVCIMCPMGCHLKCEQKGKEIIVSGNNCARGPIFAKAELTLPTRTLTALVKTSKGGVVSVKTTKPIPKKLIGKAMQELDKVVVGKSKFGQIVITNFLNTSADVVITANVYVKFFSKWLLNIC